MPCVIVLLLMGLPRVALLGAWLFGGDWVGRAFTTNIWPFLGFFLAPLTTLAWAFAMNTWGKVEGPGLAMVVVALLLDLGLLGASRRRKG
ncbi:MAG: hypothetical protein FJ296_04400 [Planctomycetes bacterium]|nr:hypothetical protein [Planctomycetota bacterium]